VLAKKFGVGIIFFGKAVLSLKNMEAYRRRHKAAYEIVISNLSQ
jgi:hypothetical protein